MNEDDLLREILDRLDTAIQMLAEVLNIVKRENKSGDELRDLKPIDAMTLIEMPPDLRKTMMAMMKLETATAESVSAITGRDASTESYYLDQLYNNGYLRKKDGIFSISDYH